MFVETFSENYPVQIAIIMITCGYLGLIHFCMTIGNRPELKWNRALYSVFCIWLLVCLYLQLILMTKEIGFAKFRLINVPELSLLMIFISLLIFSPIIKRISNKIKKFVVDGIVTIAALFLSTIVGYNIVYSKLNTDTSVPFTVFGMTDSSYVVIENLFLLLGMGITIWGIIDYFYKEYIGEAKLPVSHSEPKQSRFSKILFYSIGVILLLISLAFIERRRSELFNHIKNGIELLYYVSGIILGIGVIIGIRQLKATEQQLKATEKQFIQYTNDKTMELMKWIATDYLPMLQQFITVPGMKKYPYINGSFVIQEDRDAIQQLVDFKVDHKGNVLVNQLEFISHSVTLGLASKEVLFNAFARDYCSAVEWLYELICLSKLDGDEQFSTTIELYTKWNKQLAR